MLEFSQSLSFFEYFFFIIPVKFILTAIYFYFYLLMGRLKIVGINFVLVQQQSILLLKKKQR